MLALLLLAGTAAAQGPSGGLGRTVTAIELHLPPGMTAGDLPERVTVRRGQPLSQSAVRESIDRLWATNRFAGVAVRAFPEQDGVRVVFELSARRCFELLSAERAEKSEGMERDGEQRRGLLFSDSELILASGLSARKPGDPECPENAEYYPERLRRAVEGIREVYRARGYDEADAQVELYEQSSGIVAVFLVTEGQPTRLEGLTLAGDPGLPLSRVLAEAGLELGTTLDAKVLSSVSEGLQAVLRRERFYRAQVGEPVVHRNGQVAVLSVPVEAGPRFSLQFDGNRTFGDRQLRAVLDYTGAEALDTTVLARLERRLLSFYLNQGFTEVTVVVSETVRPDGAEAILSFDIEEGTPLFVDRLEFDGNQSVGDEELHEVVVGHVRARLPVLGPEVGQLDDPLDLEGRVEGSKVASAVLDPVNIYNEEAYRNAADALTAMYRDRGYLDAEVTLAEAVIGAPAGEKEPNRYRARVRFKVAEGERAMVRSLTVSGDPTGFKTPDLPLKVGEPLRASLIDDGQTQLTRKLNRDGYLFAAVVANLDQAEGSVTYDLHPGPLVRVGEVRFGGQVRTDEQQLRNHLTLAEGQILDPEQLFESQRNLILSGAFRQATVRVADPDLEAPIKDVEVLVKESARYAGEVGGGISLSEGPRFVVDAVAPNWNGSGINVSARGKLNYVGASALRLFPQCTGTTQAGPQGGDDEYISPSERIPSAPSQCLQPNEYLGFNGLGGRGNISFQQPRVFGLLPAKVGARADLVAERVFRPLYRFTRFAGVVGGDWTATEYLSTALQYELEHDRVSITPNLGVGDDGQNARLSERYPAGYYTLQNVRGSANLDFRDDKTNPKSGVLVQAAAELTHGLSASRDDPTDPDKEIGITDFRMLTLKASANVTFYVPIGSRVVFAASARAGQIFQLSEDSSEPVLPKRFFMGGNTSMRGFREDALIPADRREVLHQEVAECVGAVSQAGCSSEARTILDGQEPLSPGGRQFALAKAELRFPAFSGVDLGVFLEAGNLWYEPREVLSLRLLDLRYVAGAGIRYGTPIGPLAFDFGFNLAPDYGVNEQLFNFHFSIGLF